MHVTINQPEMTVSKRKIDSDILDIFCDSDATQLLLINVCIDRCGSCPPTKEIWIINRLSAKDWPVLWGRPVRLQPAEWHGSVALTQHMLQGSQPPEPETKDINTKNYINNMQCTNEGKNRSEKSLSWIFTPCLRKSSCSIINLFSFYD